MDNDIIASKKLETGRKTFYLDLKSNARGRVVRITEKVGSNRDIIMLPSELINEFIDALQDIREANNEANNEASQEANIDTNDVEN